MPDASPDIPTAAISAAPAEMDGNRPSTTPPPSSPGAARKPPRRRPDFAAAPIAGRDLALIVLQLVLATILVWQFELEEQRHLLFAMLAVLGGFLVNVQLPPRFRHAWFLAVSVAGLVAVLGVLQPAGVPALASLDGWSDVVLALSVSGSLIAAALLPIGFWARVALVMTLAAMFTWLRSNSTAACWPVIGSMFMFRMISWLHAERQERSKRTWAETAGYFLMLPNAFFPLFPVVDAKVFRETWYNDGPRAIYQTGVHWITAGLLHLFLYRVIKYEVLPSPLAVRTPSEVLLYLAANYALYLRVSGHFHIVCGMLHLFGWNLPRTHDHYFLAASFSEIWRRINIYWKDFLTKIFFYPAYFRIRSRLPIQGQRRDEIAIAVAVLWVFAWTWIAHSWQTFWILGRFPFLAEHGAIWLSVGAFVAINSVVDYRKTVRSQGSRAGLTISSVFRHSVQVVAMFLLVSSFWGLWSNKEVFLYLAHTLREATWTWKDALAISGAALTLGSAAAVVQVLESKRPAARSQQPTPARESAFRGSAGRNVALLTVAVLIAAIPANEVLSDGLAIRWKALHQEQTTAGDALSNIDGYYEQLNDGSLQAGPYLLRGDSSAQQEFAGEFLSMVRPRNDIQLLELIPGWEGDFGGAKTTVNRWGMRDKPRTLAKPAGTRRIAMVGSSIVMGLGVDDDHTITQELERLLNANAQDGAPHWEVLNFGMGRTYAVERRAMIEHKVLAFQPDIILYVAHQDELFHSTKNLPYAYSKGLTFGDPMIDEVIRGHNLTPESSDYNVASAFSAAAAQILEQTYLRLHDIGERSRVNVSFTYLPIPGNHLLPSDPAVVIKMASANGLKTIDLTGWWGQVQVDDVIGVVDQYHPRPLGTRLIAERLLRDLRAALE